MYASGVRSGLGCPDIHLGAIGRVATCDPIGNEGLLPSDPGYNASLIFDPSTGCYVDIGLTPEVVTTPGGGGVPPPDFAPEPPSMTPQLLPPLVVTAPPNPPAQAGFPWGKALLIGGLVLLVSRETGRRTA